MNTQATTERLWSARIGLCERRTNAVLPAQEGQMRVGEGEMGDRVAGLARRLGHRHRDAFPAAAAAEPRSRAWLAILLFGAVAVGLYYAPFLDPNWQAVVYVAIEAIAVAIVFASLRLNRPARPLAWALFGAGM